MKTFPEDLTMDLLEQLGSDSDITTKPIGSPPAPSVSTPVSRKSSGNTGSTSSIEDRALELLGSGVPAESVAAALGVTPSRIAQLLAQKHFSEAVAELRYTAMQQHNKRDDKYNTLEDKLLEKLERQLPLLIKPESILKAISIVNGAKRRGQSAPDTVSSKQTIINLIIPAVIAEKFSVNIHNQVTRAGEQDLLTMPSGNLLAQVEAAEEKRAEALANAKAIEHNPGTELG